MKPTQSQVGWVFEDPLEYMPGEHIYNVEQFEQFVLDIKEGKDEYGEKLWICAKTHNVTIVILRCWIILRLHLEDLNYP